MKFTILLGLAFCLLAVHAQDETTEKEKSASQKIIEASLAKIQKLFDAGIEKAQAIVTKVFDSIDKTIESVNSSIESIKQAIKDMAAKGEKYVKCAEEQKPALDEIAENTKSDVAACKEAANDRTKDVLEDLKNQAAATQKEVGQVIAQCFENSPFSAMFCATKEAAKTYAKASVSVVKSIRESRSIIAEASREAQKCIKEAQEESKLKSENIIKEIQECANAA